MSHSSALVIYQPEGAGQKPRRATFDLTLVPDPEPWLAERLGALALCQIEPPSSAGTVVAAERGLRESAPSPSVNTAVRLALLSQRLIVAMQMSLARRGRGLAAVIERLRQAASAQIPPRRCDGAANTTTATGGDK
jgi:hypothetical protein